MSSNHTFEHLPDELLLQICRYLYPSDILLAFCGLNARLNRTISDFIRHPHFSSVISYNNYLHLLQTSLPSIWSSIESLTISNNPISCMTSVFLQTIENDLPIHLKRLSLLHVDLHDIYQFVSRLTSKYEVEELIIDCKDPEFGRQQVFYGYKIAQMLFFHHPTLKSIELRGDLIFDLSHLSFLSLSNGENSNPMNINHSFHLQRLTVPLRSLNSLHLLLIHQPCLEYFSVHIGNAKTTYDYTITSFPPLMNLRELHFRSEDVVIKLEDISEFLTYFPHLKSFSLDLTTECPAFFDGEILQTLVQSLETFQFSIAGRISPTDEEQTLSTFYTPFWLETKKWYTQAYWHTDTEIYDSSYFHIYSVPFPFTHFDVQHCTDENLFSLERFSSYSYVKRMDLTATSDVNVIPFLQRCPNVQTISLEDICDDEENYGTDEEEDADDDDDQSDENILVCSSQLSLPKLSHVRHLIVTDLPGNDVTFFKRLVDVTPNLNRLTISHNDLLEIIRHPQHDLCQMLKQRISQLEIQLDHLWLSSEMRRDIPRIIGIFSKIISLTISVYAPRSLFQLLKEFFAHLLKLKQNLLCITVDNTSVHGFESFKRQGGFEFIQTWLSSFVMHPHRLELKSTSMTLWM